MFFSKFWKRKKNEDEELRLSEADHYEALVDRHETTHQVVDMCEQMIDAAREFEDAKLEYDRVTNYLNDVEIVEGLDEESGKPIYDAAYNISRLSNARSEFMKAEQKISDSQFLQMQELEDEIPDAIKRLKSNEEYLDTIKKDLKYLEGEKASCEINKLEAQRTQKQLRTCAITLFFLFGTIMFVLLVAYSLFSVDTRIMMAIFAFLAVCIGAYVFLNFQECSRQIKKSDSCRNRAVSLENRVKIKYVNMKNAVDYACAKYHVKNSYDFNYVYEQYMETVRDRERFRRTSDELEHYNRELIRLLSKYEFYDVKVWLNYSNAIIDKKEMVELKHDLLVRRQKLRARMEYNINAIAQLRSDILLHKNELGDRVEQVNDILKKISQLNMSC